MQQEQYEQHDSSWVKARSSVVWIAAILVAFAAVGWIERQTGAELIRKTAGQHVVPVPTRASLPASADLPALQAPRALTEQEREWARLAWRYFDANTDAGTGLAASVQGFPAATLWDMGSNLMALIAAHDLQLLERPDFDRRMARALDSLARLPLYDKVLPNKSYDLRILAMSDYENKPSDQGIGWSALDIARLLVPLEVLVWRHPQHTEAVRAVISRWDITRLVSDGLLWGVHLDKGQRSLGQEGRLGYEQYAARAIGLLGLDVEVAADPLAFLQWATVDGLQVPVDRRDPREFGAQNPTLSEPWMLLGLELGFTRQSAELAWRVYRAQEQRFRRTGIKTAVSEDHVDQAPYFVYSSVVNAGQPWAVVTDKGEAVPQLRTLSTKAAFAWHALYRTAYTTQLLEALKPAADPAQGWYAGLYESDGRPNRALTANTNAVVLESLAYIARGPALHHR